MIEFKQGLDPYKTMKIGSNRPIEVGNYFYAIRNLDWDPNSNQWEPTKRYTSIQSGNWLKVIEINVGGGEMKGVNFSNGAWVSYKDLEQYFKRES
jgi:hypothetical protein